MLYDEQVRNYMDMKVFVDTDSDLRLARRLKRDITERGRSVDSVLSQYIGTVKPSFDIFIAPVSASLSEACNAVNANRCLAVIEVDKEACRYRYSTWWR